MWRGYLEMRNVITWLAGAAFVAALAAPALAADMTIKGEVVDIACATGKQDAGKGEAHAACATACAKRGQPVGILTADAIYTVTGDFTANNNAKLLDFIAKVVTVSGTVVEKDGTKTINVKSIALAK